ncbi:MAG: methyltransferase [Proteobacteria bacterium]|nr:methyltransferase [Pseudomonadota bacterium]
MKYILLLLVSFSIFADDVKVVEDKLKIALESEIRTDKEKERDRNRMPISTLKFFGIKDDMKVIELIPGGGWYTKLLAPLLQEKGDFSVAYGTGGVAKSLFKDNQDFAHVTELATDAKFYKKDGAKFYSLDNADLAVKKVDMILTFRNYHNFDFAGRKAMNDAAFKALKKGGIYGVVDHTRRHMQGDNDENGRRIDPVLTIKEIQDAGFVLVDYSTLHYRPDDELRYEVGRKTVTGNTDRFTLKFKKK